MAKFMLFLVRGDPTQWFEVQSPHDHRKPSRSMWLGEQGASAENRRPSRKLADDPSK